MLFTKAEVLSATRLATNESSEYFMEKRAAERLVSFSAQQAAAPTTKHWDIFMSHAFADAALVFGLKDQLSRRGFDVYVDWIEDPTLNRKEVGKTTAEKLRQRMMQCDSLFYATTENHTNSRWMPWECGFTDGRHGHVAILPVVDGETSTFQGQEYLSLYPYAGKHAWKTTGKESIIISESATKYEEYPQWLARKIR